MNCPSTSFRWLFLSSVLAAGLFPVHGSWQAAEPEDAPLTLEVARRRALLDNPRAKAGAAAVREAEGALVQARALPDPELSGEVEDFGGDLPRWSQSQTTWSLSQAIEVPGKRGARGDAARSRVRAAEQALRAGRSDVVSEVDRDFLGLLAAQSLLALAEEDAASAREVTEAVGALDVAGEASPIEENRARNEETLAQLSLSRARTSLSEARLLLARTLGLETPDFSRAEGDLEGLADQDPPAEDASALDNSPQLGRARLELSAAASDLRAALRALWPDLTLGVGWRRYAATGEHAYVATLALPLPLFGRSRGAAQEKAAALEKESHAAREVELQIRGGERAARAEYEGAREEADRVRKELLPSAKDVYEALGEGYRRGKFRLLDLIQARRDLAEARRRSVEALVRLGRARIELERLYGVHAGDVSEGRP